MESLECTDNLAPGLSLIFQRSLDITRSMVERKHIVCVQKGQAPH